MTYSNILELYRDQQERRFAALDIEERGFICPNQFPEEMILPSSLDREGPLEDVLADAQRIANTHGVIVAVDVRCTDGSLDWGHGVETVEPKKN